jgi:hypothetical protein
MRIPNAPPYSVVFLFGATWNAVVERCPWAAITCLTVAGLFAIVEKFEGGRR